MVYLEIKETEINVIKFSLKSYLETKGDKFSGVIISENNYNDEFDYWNNKY